MANSFMWLVAHGSRPATGERLKSKGMVGPTRCPSCERGGKIESSPYPIQERAKSIWGSWPLINIGQMRVRISGNSLLLTGTRWAESSWGTKILIV